MPEILDLKFITQQKPLVSICVLTYNHENFVKEAIESFLMQRVNFDIEIVIHDDASTDQTQAILKKYDNDYPNLFKLLLQSENQKSKLGGGMGPRFNYPRAKGKYIALCEGDDYWTDPLKLQKQVDFLEGNEEYSFCFTRFQTKDERTNTFLDDENSKHFDKNQSFIDYDFERFYKGWHIGTQTVMFINTPETKNFYKQYQLPRDMHLYVELLKQGKGACLKDFCAVYRLTGKVVYTSTSKFQQIIKGAKVYEYIYKSNKDIFFFRIKIP